MVKAKTKKSKLLLVPIILLFIVSLTIFSVISSDRKEPASAAATTITTAAQLSSALRGGSGEYILGNNITWSSSSYNTDKTFSGTLDGNGKTITLVPNIPDKTNPGTDKDIGLMVSKLTGTIKNCIIDFDGNQHPYLYDYTGSAKNYTNKLGIICGLLNGGTIDNVELIFYGSLNFYGQDTGGTGINRGKGGYGILLGAFAGEAKGGATIKNSKLYHNGVIHGKAEDYDGNNDEGTSSRAHVGGFIGEVSGNTTMTDNEIMGDDEGIISAGGRENCNSTHASDRAGGVVGVVRSGATLTLNGLLYRYRGWISVFRDNEDCGIFVGKVYGTLNASNIMKSYCNVLYIESTQNIIRAKSRLEFSGFSKVVELPVTDALSAANSVGNKKGNFSNSRVYSWGDVYLGTTLGNGAYGHIEVNGIKNGNFLVDLVLAAGYAVGSIKAGSTYITLYNTYSAAYTGSSMFNIPVPKAQATSLTGYVCQFNTTLTASAPGKTYDGSGATFSVRSGYANAAFTNDVYLSVTGAGTARGAKNATTVTTPKDAGSYTCTLTNASGSKLPVGYALYADNVNAPSKVTFYAGNTYSLNITKKGITVSADAKTKTYGDADPALTYTPSGLVSGDTLSGALTRTDGNNVGAYNITQGTLTNANNPNYNITNFYNATLTIIRKTVAVKADNKSKTYGEGDPALTHSFTSGGLAYNDTFSGAITRASGESVGGYNITQGTLALSSNYTLTFASGTLTINKRAVSIKADNKSKVYGSADPSLTHSFTSGSLAFSDSFSGALTRTSGEGVGGYSIAQGSLSLSSNYTLSFTGGTFTITPKAITVTAEGKSKIYGSADPPLTYTASGLVGGDSLTGTLARTSGENVGGYDITQGTLTSANNPNYTISYAKGTLNITPKTITLSAEAKSKTYGDSDPSLTYQASGLVGSDSLVGALSRSSGESVGGYDITQGTLTNTNNPNYSITYTKAMLTINKRAVGIVADNKSKTYGEGDTAFSHTITSGSLAFSDTFSGALTRATGEDVGSYSITQGSLVLSANYTLSFSSGTFTITQRAIAVKADNNGKTYGEDDPSLTYSLTSGSLAFNDVFSGELVRVGGEDAGVYDITQNNLSLSSNYTLSFTNGSFTIAPKVAVVIVANKNKVYGESDPEFTYQVTGLIGSDALIGALSRNDGENAGNYDITQGTLTNANNPNYNVSYVKGIFSIVPKAITVTAENNSKTYGESDPTFTYLAVGLVAGDSLSGVLARDNGENTGEYNITQGSVTSLDNPNYNITFVQGIFTINKRGITIGAEDKSKTYGESDPEFTYSIASGSLAYNDTLNGIPTRDSGENVGEYNIKQGSITGANNTNYNITFINGTLTINKRIIAVTAESKTRIYGDGDPEFTYQSDNLFFGDSFSGTLSRGEGEDVGNYEIELGSLRLNGNYSIEYTPASITVTPREITVVAETQSKVYGNSDPELTYTCIGMLVFGDTFSGNLVRAEGEDVGRYAILQSTLSLGDNYVITYTSANLTITVRTIAVVADEQTKVYGENDPELGYQADSLYFGDTFSGTLTRESGEDAGTYLVEIGSLLLSSNYAISYTSADFVITKRAINIAVEDKSKIYGNADPVFTYAYEGGLVFGDEFSGELARELGENVGNYAIAQGTLSLNDNYSLSFTAGNLAITARAIVAVAEGKAKIYGNADPVLTYTYEGGLVFEDTFSGSLARELGENVGTYTIGQGSLSLSGNYTLSFTDSTLAITARAITAMAEDASKVYGDADPTLTYTYEGGLIGNDKFSGELARAGGENAGEYAIGQGTLSLSANYILNFVAGNFVITVKSIAVTADNVTKVYGSPEPLFTYQADGLVTGDSLNGALARVGGENVGEYDINIGSLEGANYSIIFTKGMLTITAKEVEVTAEDKSKTYGESDPTLAYQVEGLINGDTLNGTLARDSGENVGEYDINIGSLEGANYYITFTKGTLIITPRAIVALAQDKSKTYGEGDPSFTYTYEGSLVFADAFIGELNRESGENVGDYAIEQNTLSLSGNYILTFVAGILNITPKTIAVVAENKAKVYGEGEPEFTYTYIGSLIGDDKFSGELNRENGENVGDYAIEQNTLSLNDNYTISFTAGNFTITAKAIAVVAEDKSKVYGEGDPAFTYLYQSDALVDDAEFSGTLARAEGEDVGSYTILQGTLSLSANYAINFTASALTITIREIAVVAEDKGKIYGEGDPELTYTADKLYFNDTFSGALTRVEGENVGTYAILQGTLALSGNYLLIFEQAEFSIMLRAINVEAINQVKTYGEGDPELTYLADEEIGALVSGALTRVGGEDVGIYTILQGTLSVGENILINFTQGSLTITAKTITLLAREGSKVYGESDPELAYQVDGLVGSDTLNGALARESGENVGEYDITIGSIDNTINPNYDIIFVPNVFVVTTRAISVYADNLSKVYGNSDPLFSYTYEGSLAFEDTFNGELSRESGENVGKYTISKNTLSLNSNYLLTFNEGMLTITAKTIVVTADNKNKLYGESDPALSYQADSLCFNDTFSGEIDRESGEDVGVYAILQNTLSLNDNYILIFEQAELIITVREINVYADSQAKVYGEDEPILTYQADSLCFNDTFSGMPTRESGEDVGTYAILQGELCLSANYTINFVSALLSISTKTITLKANDLSKNYGDSDPEFTYIVVGELVGDDRFSGTLAREEGENVGAYAILQGTLALSSNYELLFEQAELSIQVREISVDAISQAKVYGEGDPMLTYQADELYFGDTFSGSLIREQGENVGSYAILQGTLTLDSNYNITFSANLFSIVPRPITVIADDKIKVYNGEEELTYTVIGTLVFGDSFSGELERESGENAGSYAIYQGTLSLSGNYNLFFEEGILIITSKVITVTALNVSKSYGDADPELTYAITEGGLLGEDTLSVELSRARGESVGEYIISADSITLSGNYFVDFEQGIFTITARPLLISVDNYSKVYGERDPSFSFKVQGLLDGDMFALALSRKKGENVGDYAIIISSLLLSNNYTVILEDSKLSITARAITIIADNQSKIHNTKDPKLTYQIEGLRDGDTLSGALAREKGEAEGVYRILQGDLGAQEGEDNYAITFIEGELIIKAPVLSVITDEAQVSEEISIITQGGFTSQDQVYVEVNSSESFEKSIESQLKKSAKIIEGYNISYENYGAGEALDIKIKLNNADYDNKLTVYRVASDGTLVKLSSNVDKDGNLSFSTDELGTFILTSEAVSSREKNIIIFVSLMITIAVVLLYVTLTLKKTLVKKR